ncbi:MAG: trypsin-like peptidase domain-containing protein [Nocardioidaceae bacterium]
MPRTALARTRLPISALTTLLLMTVAAPAAAEDSSPSPSATPNNATVLAAKAYPGVQLIATTYTATVRVQVPVVNQSAVNALAQRIGQQALVGAIDPTREAITEEIVDAVVKSPNTYFVASSQVYSRRNSLTGVGTGWVITPDGYLLTAAHVVSTPKAQLRQEFAMNSLAKLGRQFVNGIRRSGTKLTSDQVDRLRTAVLGWLAGHLSVDRLRVSVSAELALGFDGLGKDQKPVAAEVVDSGKPYPGNDVALLKIDGQEHLPTIAVGDNDDVSPGSTVHVVGFPAASTFSPGLSRDAQVQPTVTEGPVTAVKSTAGGMPVIQTQAPASPGNSGGPVLTDNGSAVGVLVASAVGSDGVAAQGQNFVIPASEIRDMLERNGVKPEESDTTANYARAVDEFYAEHYSAALPLFEKVESLYPAHPFAQKFVLDSKTAIDEGRDKTPKPASKKPWILGLVGAGLVGLLGGGGLWLALRRRGRASTPAATEAGPYAFAPGAVPSVVGPGGAVASEAGGAAGGGGVASAGGGEAGVPAVPPPPQPLWDPERGWYLPEQTPAETQTASLDGS